jgi:hypothetical protein
MEQTGFVGVGIHKERILITVAESGRLGAAAVVDCHPSLRAAHNNRPTR